MKSLKQIAIASLALGALSANADYTFSSTVTDGGISGVTANTVIGPITSPYTGKSANVYNLGNVLPFSGVSTFDVSVAQVGSAGLGPYLGNFSFNINDVYEAPNLTANYVNVLGSLFTVQAISVTETGSGAVGGALSGSDFNSTAGNYGAGSYVVTVDWTLNGIYGSYPNWMSTFDISTSSVIQSSGDTAGGVEQYITAVPEPGQVIGGCMLLGCGALVFTGRRFMAKKA